MKGAQLPELRPNGHSAPPERVVRLIRRKTKRKTTTYILHIYYIYTIYRGKIPKKPPHIYYIGRKILGGLKGKREKILEKTTTYIVYIEKNSRKIPKNSRNIPGRVEKNSRKNSRNILNKTEKNSRKKGGRGREVRRRIRKKYDV